VPVEHASGRAQVRTFSTMMTGELYAWLVDGSLLCRGISEARAWSDEAFGRGVARAAGDGPIIEELFRTRARWLLGDLEPAAAPSFLSGLLIGHELAAMTRRFSVTDALVVAGARKLCALYQHAARQLGVATEIISDEDAIVAGFRRMNDAQ
jgi:2-dehydro-3-deoxygalactonokinase